MAWRPAAAQRPGARPTADRASPPPQTGARLAAALAAVCALACAAWLHRAPPRTGVPLELARGALTVFWIWTAVRAARAWTARHGSGQTSRERGLRTFLWSVVYALASSAVTGALGRFDVLSLSLVHAVVFVACPAPLTGSTDTRARLADLARGLRSAPLCAVAFFILAALGIANAAWGLLSPVYHVDDLVYHLPFPIEWMQTGRLDPHLVPFGNHSPAYHPKNVELLYAWLLVPLRRVEVASLVQVAFAAASVGAAYDLLRRLRVGPPAALVSASTLLASATVTRFFDSAYVDFAFMFAFLASLGALLRLRTSCGKEARGDWLELWVALGLFAGTKSFGILLTAVVLAPAGVVLLAGRLRRVLVRPNGSPGQGADRGPARLVTPLLTAAGAWTLAGGWWSLRNLLTTGNPIFPMRAELAGLVLFDGPYGREAFESATLRRLIPLLPWPLAATVAIGALVTLVRAVRPTGNPDARVRALVWLGIPLALATVFVWLLPTGHPRFVLALVPLTAGCLAAGLEARPPLGRGFAALTLVALTWTLVTKSPNLLLPLRGGSLLHTPLVDGAFVALCVVLGLSALALCVRLPREPLWWAAIAALAAPALVAAAATSDPAGPHVPERVARAWEPYLALERAEGPTRIAVTGTNQKLRAYGRGLANRVGYADVNGARGALFHEHFARRRGAVEPTPGDEAGVAYYRAEPDPEAWLANLDAMGARFLVVSRLPPWAVEQAYVRDGKHFPLERRWARARPERFELHALHPGLEIFRILPRP